MACMRSSVGVEMYSRSFSSLQSSNFFLWMWQQPDSRERIALRMLSSRVRPIDITSPVAFICVPSSLDASLNLSKGKRATLATT